MKPQFWVFLAIALMVYFGLFYSASVYGDTSRIQFTTAKLIEETPDGITYEFGFAMEPISKSSDCSEKSQETLDLYVASKPARTSDLPNYVNGTIGKETQAKEVILNGLAGTNKVCSDMENDVQIDYSDVKAYCTIDKDTIENGVQRASISCSFYGIIKPTDSGKNVKFYGLDGGSVRVTFLKEKPNIPVSQVVTIVEDERPIISKTSSGVKSIFEIILNFLRRIFNV